MKHVFIGLNLFCISHNVEKLWVQKLNNILIICLKIQTLLDTCTKGFGWNINGILLYTDFFVCVIYLVIVAVWVSHNFKMYQIFIFRITQQSVIRNWLGMNVTSAGRTGLTVLLLHEMCFLTCQVKKASSTRISGSFLQIENHYSFRCAGHYISPWLAFYMPIHILNNFM